MNLPPYKLFPVVHGDQIRLRQVLSTDLSNLVDISFYDAVQAKTIEQAAEMQEQINRDYTEGTAIHWGIAEESTAKIIGTCGYYRGFDQAAGELGCVLLPQYQGKGYMTTAMQLAIDFGLNTMGLTRIWAVTNRHNEKAIRLLERLRFKKIKDLEDAEVEYELVR